MEMEPTGQGLVDFWTYVIDKSLMPSNTAGALRGASKEVLSAVEPESWQTLDLRELDVEDFNERFSRRRASKFKPETLHVYKSRFKNAVAMYTEFLENPSGWRYKAKKPYKSRSRPAAGPEPETAKSTVDPSNDGQDPKGNYELPPVHTLEHQYPLRPNLIVKVQLPVDLTKTEATKLSGFITSLVQEPMPALPARPDDEATGS
jgi:hypothetical protein